MTRRSTLVSAPGARRLGVAALLALGACHEPRRAAPPDAPSAAAPAGPAAAPLLGGGGLGPTADPVDALKARTYAVEVQGTIVHAGTTAGVVTWDYADVSAPRELATVVLAGSVAGLVAVDEGTLAVSTGPTGLVLVDTRAAGEGRLLRLSDSPWTPEARSGCHAVWAARIPAPDRAVLACATGGVGAADLADRAHPRVTRVVSVPGVVRDVALLDGGLVLAAAGVAGLAVVDLAAGRVVAALPTVEGAESRALTLSGGLAYVADGPGGLWIVDVRDPAHPRELSRTKPPSVDLARGVALEGRALYLCLGDSGLAAIDVTDPARPLVLGSIDPRRAVNRATAVGGRIYAANDAGGILVAEVGKAGELRQLAPPAE